MSTMLAMAVASLEGVHPTELDPLAHTIDTDAIDRLVAEGKTPDVDGEMTFEYAGYVVSVAPCGLAELVPVTEESHA